MRLILNQLISRTDNLIIKFEKILLVASFSILFLSSLSEILLRHINIQVTILSPIIRFSTFFICFLGGSLAVANNKSIRLDIARKLPFIKNHSYIHKMVYLIAAIISLYLLVLAVYFLKMEISFNEDFHSPIKVWHLELIFPLFFFNTSFHFCNLYLKEKW